MSIILWGDQTINLRIWKDLYLYFSFLLVASYGTYLHFTWPFTF